MVKHSFRQMYVAAQEYVQKKSRNSSSSTSTTTTPVPVPNIDVDVPWYMQNITPSDDDDGDEVVIGNLFVVPSSHHSQSEIEEMRLAAK